MMIKKITFLGVLLLGALLLLTAGSPVKRVSIKNKNTLKTGAEFIDFTVGMKESTIYNLRDLISGRFTVLSFLDSSAASTSLISVIAGNIESIKSSKPGILWLNITRDKKHAEINEMTSVLNLRYRTLNGNIPRGYDFSTSPALLIIDPHGIIQFVYLGYSPTLIEDIKKWLRSVK